MPGELSNLQQRVLSGVVMAALALGATLVGGPAFRVLAAVIAAAMFLEWQGMMPRAGRSRRAVPAILFVVAATVLAFGASVLLTAGAALVLGLAAAIAAERDGQGASTASGFAYAFLTGFCLAHLREGGNAGLLAILFLFAVVWATDIGAYFVGRAMGGPKLAPGISPGKTWSGAIGGTICAAIAGLIVMTATGQVSAGMLVLAILLSIVAQAGDLFESSVKRRAGVKDSGKLIPGHGGVMDRVDGLATAAMLLYLVGAIAGDIAEPAKSLF